mmetsp:Transcript_2622/g.6299  ORF Transcript_2622/g.6299 Transcript_2622/m.6299 type:complete len:165 (+) Transcript_2622:87-581(+)
MSCAAGTALKCDNVPTTPGMSRAPLAAHAIDCQPVQRGQGTGLLDTVWSELRRRGITQVGDLPPADELIRAVPQVAQLPIGLLNRLFGTIDSLNGRLDGHICGERTLNSAVLRSIPNWKYFSRNPIALNTLYRTEFFPPHLYPADDTGLLNDLFLYWSLKRGDG